MTDLFHKSKLTDSLPSVHIIPILQVFPDSLHPSDVFHSLRCFCCPLTLCFSVPLISALNWDVLHPSQTSHPWLLFLSCVYLSTLASFRHLLCPSQYVLCILNNPGIFQKPSMPLSVYSLYINQPWHPSDSPCTLLSMSFSLYLSILPHQRALLAPEVSYHATSAMFFL